MCNLILSHLTYTHQLGKHLAKATFTNVHTAFSQPSDGCTLCSLSLPFQSYVLRIADTGNAAMVILTGLLMVTALLPALYANNSCAHFIILVFLFTTVTSKCLVSINEFACAMGGDFCCTCFTGGETETHTRSSHHTVGWAVQSGLELKTSKTCCHMFRELERKQLKLSTEHFCLPSIWSTKARQTFPHPCCQPMAMERIWSASTAHIYSPALPSPALRTVQGPSRALRHSVSPADWLCARTALCPAGSGRQDQLWVGAKSSSPTEWAPGMACIWHCCCLVMQLWLHRWGRAPPQVNLSSPFPQQITLGISQYPPLSWGTWVRVLDPFYLPQ